MISLHNLSFLINQEVVFNNISMSFLPSSIIYIKGKNGSGKTSLMRMIAGIQSPTSGNITATSSAIPISEMQKPYCTYIGHKLGIKTELTVLENLEFMSKIYDSCELLDAAIVYFNMQNIIEKKCYELSAGMQKKVALARLIICQSKLWLLDEVDTNLDQDNKELLIRLIISHADSGGIVFIASHNEHEIKTGQILDLSYYSN